MRSTNYEGPLMCNILHAVSFNVYEVHFCFALCLWHGRLPAWQNRWVCYRSTRRCCTLLCRCYFPRFGCYSYHENGRKLVSSWFLAVTFHLTNVPCSFVCQPKHSQRALQSAAHQRRLSQLTTSPPRGESFSFSPNRIKKKWREMTNVHFCSYFLNQFFS